MPIKKNINILALGAESAGIFVVYQKGSLFISKNFGDLLDDDNFSKYKKAILFYLRKEKIEPDVILTDLHPLFKTTIFGEELSKKFKITQMKVQHHIAHVFSAVGDKLLQTKNYRLKTGFFGIAMDGTGYGLDGNIWGSEIFRIMNYESGIMNKKKADSFEIQRIGSLEEQIMIGGDLAVREPARMLIAILARIMNYESGIKNKTLNTKIIKTKDDIYKFVKKFYSRNQFEVLFSQLEQDFNCQKTTSTGRILDAVSVLLGFAGNERKYKHEAVKLLEENSTVPYEIELRIMNYESRQILNMTYLFDYLIKNIHKDKRRLAATAQLYIAKGLYEILKPYAISNLPLAIFAAGGMANNKIISGYLEKQGVCLAKKIPRGDEGMAFGQIFHYLLNDF